MREQADFERLRRERLERERAEKAKVSERCLSTKFLDIEGCLALFFFLISCRDQAAELLRRT